MSEDFSLFGQRFCTGSGIEELMEDLGNALNEGGQDVKMLGGGQPAAIPEMNALWQRRMKEIAAQPKEVEKILCNYEPPRGNSQFLKSLAKMLRNHFGWPITERNIAITAGGQMAFFYLFNALGGSFANGTFKKILLPIVPEYIGYAKQSIGEDVFKAYHPKIELIGKDQFKYRVDFDALEITEDVAAICISRPTNPSGNVLMDCEMHRLSLLAEQHNIPLIIDNAYGAPFPNIFFADAEPLWNENIILSMSLSKLGLPGTRTGIVVANEEIAGAVASMNAIIGLANGNLGQALILPLIETGEVLRLSNEVVKPYYRNKSLQAQEWLREAFANKAPFRMHLSEGALFLWLWFEALPISSSQLYERLKKRGVLIVSGHYFFFGTESQWRHQQECIRMTFTMPDTIVKKGIEIIADEVAMAYNEKSAKCRAEDG